jgi:hypothetical protein
MKAEVKAEGERVLRTVDEERNYAIQATIVRIMKVRKVQPLHRSGDVLCSFFCHLESEPSGTDHGGHRANFDAIYSKDI